MTIEIIALSNLYGCRQLAAKFAEVNGTPAPPGGKPYREPVGWPDRFRRLRLAP